MSIATMPQFEDLASPAIDLAGRGARLSAAFVDGVIQTFLAVAFINPIEAAGISDESGLVLEAIVICAYLAVNGYFLARDGQTLGKKLVGIKIVRTDGRKAGLGRIVGLRYLPLGMIGVIPLLGGLIGAVDALFIFRASRQCLHDQLADTIVVNA